jgi:hypothetical protein
MTNIKQALKGKDPSSKVLFCEGQISSLAFRWLQVRSPCFPVWFTFMVSFGFSAGAI